MKRSITLAMLLAAGITANAANSLLSSPVTGALGSTHFNAMAMASNGTDAVLLLGDASSLYAIDIADNDPKELVANAITSVPDFVNSKLVPVAGGVALTVIDMEVNPISKALYVLAESSGKSYVFKVRNAGSTITLMDLSATSHSTIGWGATFSINDMTWGKTALYASSGSFSLNGSVATVPAPFKNGTTVSQRSTSMFKSNWGGSYMTDAPLETIGYGEVKGVPRLMGVTTCAPGFSLEVSKLGGSGVLQVTEDFNVNMGVSSKVIFMHHDGRDWLFDLHDNKIYRLGASLIDGSPVKSGAYNNAAVMLRSNTGVRAAGIADTVMLTASGTYSNMAQFDDYRLVLLETGGTLKMLKFATTAPGLAIDETTVAARQVRIYPNPAHQTLNVELQEAVNATLQVYAMDGRMVQSAAATTKNTSVDISALAPGQYVLKAVSAAGSEGQQVFIVQ